MSFIYDDKKLLDNLIKSAIDYETKLNKTAASPFNVGAVQKLVTQLLRSVDPDNNPQPAPITSGTDHPVDLKVENLQNISNLLTFLSSNKIQYDSKQIAYGPEEQAPTYLTDAEDDKTALLMRVNTHREVDPTTRKLEWRAKRYIADRAALIAYLRDLQWRAKKNRVLQVMVGKLITQANSFGIDEITPKEIETPIGLNDATNVDGFVSSTIDYNNWYAGTERAPLFTDSTFKLTARDIKSRESFNAWLRQNQIKFKDAKGKEQTLGPNMDICTLIHLFWKRAQYLAGAGTPDPDFTKIAKYYMQQIQKIGSQYTYTDSSGNVKPCPVVSLPGIIDKDKDKDKDKTPGSDANTTAVLTRIMSALPLETDDISFSRILIFFRNLEGLYGYQTTEAEQRAEFMKGKIAATKTSIDRVRSYLREYNQSEFPLTNIRLGVVNSWLKPEQTPNLVQFIGNLQQVLTDTQLVIKSFQAAYGKQVGSQGMELLSQQADSIFNDNWRNLAAWKDDALKFKRT